MELRYLGFMPFIVVFILSHWVALKPKGYSIEVITIGYTVILITWLFLTVGGLMWALGVISL